MSNVQASLVDLLLHSNHTIFNGSGTGGVFRICRECQTVAEGMFFDPRIFYGSQNIGLCLNCAKQQKRGFRNP